MTFANPRVDVKNASLQAGTEDPLTPPVSESVAPFEAQRRWPDVDRWGGTMFHLPECTLSCQARLG